MLVINTEIYNLTKIVAMPFYLKKDCIILIKDVAIMWLLNALGNRNTIQYNVIFLFTMYLYLKETKEKTERDFSLHIYFIINIIHLSRYNEHFHLGQPGSLYHDICGSRFLYRQLLLRYSHCICRQWHSSQSFLQQFKSSEIHIKV